MNPRARLLTWLGHRAAPSTNTPKAPAMNQQAANETAQLPPSDCVQNAHGHWVPKSKVKPIDRQRDEVVLELVAKAKAMSAQLRAFKASALADVHAFRELAAERYGAKAGGAKGNVTLTSYSGNCKITLQVQEKLTFDEGLQIAKSLVDELVTEWAKDANDNIRALVTHAFQTDKAGKVSTSRVLQLRELEITDDKWERAMGAIADSMHVQSSVTYLRFYERVGDTDKYECISLDVAAL